MENNPIVEMIGILASIIGFAVAITWLIFPFLVIGRMNRTIKLLESLETKLFVLATNSNEAARSGQPDEGTSNPYQQP